MVKMFLFYKLRTTCKKGDSEWFLFKTANFDSHFLRTIGLIKKMSVYTRLTCNRWTIDVEPNSV